MQEQMNVDHPEQPTTVGIQEPPPDIEMPEDSFKNHKEPEPAEPPPHEEVKKPNPEKPKAEVVVAVEKDGNYGFSNQLELANAASMMIQTSMAPDHLKKEGKPAVMAAMVLCKQFNLPQKAMNQMAFVKGKLTCYGSLVTAIAQKHKKYGEKREFFVDENIEEICVANKNLKAKPYAAVVQIKKKGEHHWTEYFFTIEDAEEAKLLTSATKPDSGWRKYMRDMLMHKARKRALNAEYASALEGIEYHEDVAEVYETARDVTDADDTQTEAQKLEEELMG